MARARDPYLNELLLAPRMLYLSPRMNNLYSTEALRSELDLVVTPLGSLLLPHRHT